MQTDRSPINYLYLSRRLLTGVVQQDEASLSRSNWSVNVSPVPVVGVSRERKPPDYDNLYDLAVRSTEATSDHTGSIDNPWGIYLHGEMEMHFGVFPPHQGWEGHVACYRGESKTADDQPVYVALFGSGSNVIGRRPTDDTSEWYPSSVDGLYMFLDSIREDGDPEVDLIYRTADYGMSVEARVETALRHANGGARADLGRLEFLAVILLAEDDHESREIDFSGRVILAAPLWVATPNPKPFPGWKG